MASIAISHFVSNDRFGSLQSFLSPLASVHSFLPFFHRGLLCAIAVHMHHTAHTKHGPYSMHFCKAVSAADTYQDPYSCRVCGRVDFVVLILVQCILCHFEAIVLCRIGNRRKQVHGGVPDIRIVIQHYMAKDKKIGSKQ